MDATPLTTNHVEIGVFWHPYHKKNSRLIRDSETFPLHRQAARDENPPNFAVHALRPNGRQPVRGARAPNPFFSKPFQYDEFDDYEHAYNNSVPPWNLRAIGPDRPLLPVRVSHQPLARSNPIGYMESVLDGFVRFDDPRELLTEEEINRLQDPSDSDNIDSLVGSILNARRSKLNPDNLFASMRLLAEKVLERAVFSSQTPAKLGVGEQEYKRELADLDNLIGSILSVRKEYLKTGDIKPDEELFADFDSKQDADDFVNDGLLELGLDNNDDDDYDDFPTETEIIIKKLRSFSASKILIRGNELDVATAEKEQLEKLSSPTQEQRTRKFELTKRIAILSQDRGLRPTRDLARTVVKDFEKAKTAIASKRAGVEKDEQAAKKDAKSTAAEVKQLEEDLRVLKSRGQDESDVKKELGGAKTRLRIIQNRFLRFKTTRKEIEDETRDIEREAKKGYENVTESLKRTRGLPRLNTRLSSRPRKITPKPELYERAISLVVVDLVEKELRSLQFRTDKRAQIDDAVSTIENVRFQLPDGSKHLLARFAGRGTLPFALVASDSTLSVEEVTKDYTPATQTQTAINQLIAN